MSKETPPPTSAELRWFGVLVPTALAAIGAVLLWRLDSRVAASIPWSIGLAVGLCFLSLPRLRLPLYRSWMRATRPLGALISHLMLAVIFYLVITPLAVVLRLFGRDALALRSDAASPSYWSARARDDDLGRYFRQS
jgi:hypothetical protein